MSTYCKCGYPVDMAALETNRRMIEKFEFRRLNPPIYETVVRFNLGSPARTVAHSSASQQQPPWQQ